MEINLDAEAEIDTINGVESIVLKSKLLGFIGINHIIPVSDIDKLNNLINEYRKGE